MQLCANTKNIEMLEDTKNSCEEMVYESKDEQGDSSAESFESWSDSFDGDSDDEHDELNLSFREGLKRAASENFCHDLKRIKCDNNMRVITDTMTSFDPFVSDDNSRLKQVDYSRQKKQNCQKSQVTVE